MLHEVPAHDDGPTQPFSDPAVEGAYLRLRHEVNSRPNPESWLITVGTTDLTRILEEIDILQGRGAW